MIAEGLLGMTSNPSIFEAPSAEAVIITVAMKVLAAAAGVEQIYDALTIEDVGMAADEFRTVFRQTHGVDGDVSIEVSPKLRRYRFYTLADARLAVANPTTP
ncbi:MAG: transaldolase family protein [Anaerolineae bacterium]